MVSSAMKHERFSPVFFGARTTLSGRRGQSSFSRGLLLALPFSIFVWFVIALLFF